MLIKCPECGLQASDKALSCPHCGLPFQQNHNAPKIRKSNRRRRLPNGFGQITEIKGRPLKKPFRAMITVSKDENGRPICRTLKPVAYFETYNEAYEALVIYNKNPYDVTNNTTMNDLYEQWSKYHFEHLKSESAKRGIKATWKYCRPIHDVLVMELRTKNIRECLDNGSIKTKDGVKPASSYMKLRMKQVISQMLDYAVEYEMVDRNVAKNVKIPNGLRENIEDNRKGHITFTEDEMKTLWHNVGDRYVDMILIQCYSGWRPQELCLLEIKNIDLIGNAMVGGLKTKAGKGRYVPIHPKIKDMLTKYYNEAVNLNAKYVFNRIEEGKYKDIPYGIYRWNFISTMERLGLSNKHLPHDPRKQFITSGKLYKMDEFAIKYIVGHAIKDVTEKIYTDRKTEWLQQEIQKIK